MSRTIVNSIWRLNAILQYSLTNFNIFLCLTFQDKCCLLAHYDTIMPLLFSKSSIHWHLKLNFCQVLMLRCYKNEFVLNLLLQFAAKMHLITREEIKLWNKKFLFVDMKFYLAEIILSALGHNKLINYNIKIFTRIIALACKSCQPIQNSS